MISIFILFIIQLNQVQAALYGSCGTQPNSCLWSFDSTTNILEISGNGEMDDYFDVSDIPWYSYAKSVSQIVIQNG